MSEEDTHVSESITPPTSDTIAAAQEAPTVVAAPAAEATTEAREIDGNIVTEAAAAHAEAAGVLTAKNLYGTGPTGEPVAPEQGARLDWRQGLDHVRDTLAREGYTLSQAAAEFVGRALGELYQHEQGGPPASQAAREMATRVSGAPTQETATYLNEQGRYLQETEGAQFNAKGYHL